ncbi:rho family-interacting cell polarization regulator 1 isoform X2 [Oreochromis niloticus]|nr:rho family-interacting cell polarization regulator 1 isoform X2 [Oreochromis niloticus]XP_005454299.1 rho family-interacting cell polarization regulator 1 isoform X2 [Oreochromis niloticus]XP_019216746.1 rho family-interacting cell polarization regulator 1 isoform X2 [Oreochromis niloticus]
MSLSIRPVRRLTSRSITRSQSFTGVNTHDKPYRNLVVFSTPGLSRKPSRASRLFTMSIKANPPPKVPQPERLDEVYEALKKGLQSYLQVHQMDLETLTRQIKESKRNSRLGFLYELDKQVKVTERYIRKLEFHLSKIEEFYESYCMQRRLRDGANKMVKAYTASSGSKEAKESLAEASKGYKEYTENMCVLENDFENQLGKFHIKMKGLAGFARLCAGDQYEIFMKYGRQRWKLRGRIEINAKQVWDSEEIVFQPLINEFLSVKVTELKSLANHVVVGSVSCETKDLFAALPQMVAVDINDLGTIKLSLEVTWNPFDKDDQGSVASTVNKPPSINKRISAIFDQTPPDTPPLRNMIRLQGELENGPAWSNSSESSDDSTSPQLPAHPKAVVVTPDIQPVGQRSSLLQPDVSSCSGNWPSSAQTASQEGIDLPKQPAESNRHEEKGTVTVITKPAGEEEAAGKHSSMAPVDVPIITSSYSTLYLRSLSHISENSADGVVVPVSESGDVMSLVSGISINDIEMEVASRTPESLSSADTDTAVDVTDPHPIRKQHNTSTSVDTSAPLRAGADSNAVESGDVTYLALRVPVEEDIPAASSNCLSAKADAPVDSGLEDALVAVLSSIDDYRGPFSELQLLEQELKLLQVTLKGGRHSRSPSVVSLTVETALGSFDFLNGSDWEEEEGDGDKRSRNSRSLLDRGWDSPSSSNVPLTTGCTTLDCCLVVHLKNCNAQLLRLGKFGPLRCGEMYALDRLLREARVLEIIRRVTKENPQKIRPATEVIPELGLCLGAVSLWQECVGQGSVYSVSAESFLNTLLTIYAGLLPERAEEVFLCLVERVLDQRLPRRGSSRDNMMVTLFQLWSYLDSNAVSDMDTHIVELAKEVWLVQNLVSSDQDVIVSALRRPAECSLRREGIHAVAKLLKDPRGKVSASASSVLRSLAAQPRQRKQALVSCLELLEDENVDNRVCGCKALACLKAKESIDQLVYLCRADKEEVRDAAKQTLLVLGEEGKMAHRHVETSQDSISRLFAPGSMASTAF